MDGLSHAPQWILVPLPVFTPESVDGIFTCTTTDCSAIARVNILYQALRTSRDRRIWLYFYKLRLPKIRLVWDHPKFTCSDGRHRQDIDNLRYMSIRYPCHLLQKLYFIIIPSPLSKSFNAQLQAMPCYSFKATVHPKTFLPINGSAVTVNYQYLLRFITFTITANR